MKRTQNVTLIDRSGCTFKSLNSDLNFRMKEKAAQGIGIVVNWANFISEKWFFRQPERGVTSLLYCYFSLGFWYAVCS